MTDTGQLTYRIQLCTCSAARGLTLSCCSSQSTAHPDRRFVRADSWTAAGFKIEMLETFHGFCPSIQKHLGLVLEGDVLEWKLGGYAPLDS